MKENEVPDATIEAIRQKRRSGVVLGDLMDQYGAEAVVQALGVRYIAAALGVPVASPFPQEPDEWRDRLDTALEHAAHAWAAVEKQGGFERVDPDAWPPKVRAPVGSVPYHVAVLIRGVWEVYQGIYEQHPDEAD